MSKRGRKRIRPLKIKPTELGTALRERLELYSEDITEGINAQGKDAVTKMVKLTKQSAPVGIRGKFKDAISSKEIDKGYKAKSYVWYVKEPHYRLTHLLVKGHATVNGGRTKADPFLQNALDAVLPEYEKAVEEVIKNGN